MAVVQHCLRLSKLLRSSKVQTCSFKVEHWKSTQISRSIHCVLFKRFSRPESAVILQWPMCGSRQPLQIEQVRTLRKSSMEHHNSNNNNKSSENIDDLKSILQDKSMSLTAKFKFLFQQYGVVLVIVHLITAAFWMSLFYFAVSKGFDIIPFFERHGVFEFLAKIGLPVSDKLKSPGASNLLAAYLLYEVAKPIRYPVTIVGTIYAVRILRKLKYLKRPPKTDATVKDLVQTQGKIVRHHIKHRTSVYQEKYASRRRKSRKHKNGKH